MFDLFVLLCSVTAIVSQAQARVREALRDEDYGKEEEKREKKKKRKDANQDQPEPKTMETPETSRPAKKEKETKTDDVFSPQNAASTDAKAAPYLD